MNNPTIHFCFALILYLTLLFADIMQSPRTDANTIAKGSEGILTAIGPLILLSIGALFTLGAVESYIVPMMPFMLWFFAVMGCASFAVEFVCAAPLSALQHCKADGDDLIGQDQKPYYDLLFNAALRPTLLLFGLFAANKVFAVMAGYLNQTFSMAMLASQGSHIVGLVGFLVSLALICYLHYHLAIKCMELVHRVPKMVSHMLGVNDLHEDPHRQMHDVHAAVVGISHSGGNTLKQMITPQQKPNAGSGDQGERKTPPGNSNPG